MRVIRKTISVLLLLCLLFGCTKTVSPKYGTTATFSEAKAKAFDPSKHKGTFWEANHGFLTVSESGEVSFSDFDSSYRLLPEGDRFAIEVQLYRTLQDDEPALTLSAGTARITADGDILRLQVKDDPLRCFSDEQKEIYFQPAVDPNLKNHYKSFTVDIETYWMLIQSQPNSEWRNRYGGFHNGPQTLLTADRDGAVSGEITVGRSETPCELLIGHRGDSRLCAIVRENAMSIDDVLVFGKHEQTIEDRRDARRFVINVTYDPNHLLDAESENRFYLYSQIETEDPAEKNWMGMNLYEFLYWMEREGWQSEEVYLFDFLTLIYCLKKGNETIMVSAGRDFAPHPSGDLYIQGYVRYRDRAVQSWAGHTPKDHTIAEQYELREGQSCAYVFLSVAYSPASGYEYYLLDDCRIAGISTDWFGTGEEDGFIIYDPLTAD